MLLKVGFASAALYPSDALHSLNLIGFGDEKTLLRKCLGEHVESPIHLHALLLADESQKVAMLSLDVLGINANLVKKIRREASQRLRIDALLVAATHTHSAPPLVDTCTDPQDTSFSKLVESRAVDALAMAETVAEPATLASAKGEAYVNRSRRPPSENRPVDRTVRVLQIETSSGRKVLLVRYTCHPVCFGIDSYLASSDFIGYLEAKLRPDELLFLNGCAGYVNPTTPGTNEDLTRSGEKGAMQVADAVAEAVLHAPRKSMRSTRLDWSKQSVNIKLEPLCPELPPYAPLDITALQLGDVFIVGQPGEPFTESGKRIEESHPSKEVWVTGYADGYVGYLIDDVAEQRAKSDPSDYEAGLGPLTAPRLIGYKVKPSDTLLLESAAEKALQIIIG